MEEKKLNHAEMKVVKGNESQEEKKQKLTYEQLNETCMQLYQQNQNLMRQLQQANMTSMFKRLDYLFMVLGCADKFDESFVKSCAVEIQNAITVEQPGDEEQKEG